MKIDYWINNFKSFNSKQQLKIAEVIKNELETDELFNETLEFAKEIGFSKIHVFPYSRRHGTKADSMPNQIDEHVKKEELQS